MRRKQSAARQLFDYLTPPPLYVHDTPYAELEHYDLAWGTARLFHREILQYIIQCREEGLRGHFRFGMAQSGLLIAHYSQHGGHGLGFWEEVRPRGLIYGVNRKGGGSRIDGLWASPAYDAEYPTGMLHGFLAAHALPCNAVTARSDTTRASWYKAAGFERIYDEDESIIRWAHG